MNSDWTKVLTEIEIIASKVIEHPNAVVLIYHSAIEQMVAAMISSKLKAGSKWSNKPYALQVDVLREIGEISDKEFALLDKFRKIRNNIAHNVFYKLSQADADKIGELVNDFNDIERGQGRHTFSPNELISPFTALKAAFWNAHASDLMNSYIPDAVDEI